MDSAGQPITQPPLSNRGVTKIPDGVATSLDWLRYSVPWPDNQIPQDGLQTVLRQAFHPSEKITFTGEFLTPPKGYDTCLALNYGTVRYHSALPQQKIGVEFTGRNLSELRSQGLPAIDLLAFAVTAGGRFSRIDLALDIFGQDADPMDIQRAWLAGKLVTRAQAVSHIEQQRRDGDGFKSDGVTVYVGSRASDRFIRVYDKAREQNLDGVKWTRIEFQVGGDLARVFADVLPNVKLPEFIQTAIRGFCAAPTVPWYQNALTGLAEDLPQVPRRDSDRKRWLLKQVLPALQAELVACEQADDWELYDAFWGALQMYINREQA